MDTFSQAAASGWGVGAGVVLVLAAAAALVLRGPLRGVGALAGLAIAGILGFLALGGTEPEPAPETAFAVQAGNRSAADAAAPHLADGRGLEFLTEAERLLNLGDQEAAERALNQALDWFRDQQDLVGQGHVYLQFGRAAHFTGQSDDARGHFDRALDLFGEAATPADEARVLMARGDLEKDTFQWDAAGDFYRRGRQVWAAVEGPKSDPHPLLALETAATMPDGEAAAWEVLDQAAAILDAVGDNAALADVAVARADLYRITGDTVGARGQYSLASEKYSAAGNIGAAAVSALNAAQLDILAGFNLSAFALLDQADAGFAAVSDDAGRARVHVARGDALRLVGYLPAALGIYRYAAAQLAALGDPAEAEARLKFGQVAISFGDSDEALPQLEAAMGLFADAGQPKGQSSAHLALGHIAAAAGDPATAMEHWAAALDLAQGAGDPLTEGRARLEMAGLAGAAGQPDLAGEHLAAAQSRFRDAGSLLGEILAILVQGDVAAAADDPAAAQSAYRQAAAAIAAMADPVAESNRYLGLPAVNVIDLDPATALDDYNDGDDLDPAVINALEAERQANLAAHPDHNFEARTLLAQVEARIEAATATAD